MKVLITGGKGMLGRTLQKCWQDWELVIADLPEADIQSALSYWTDCKGICFYT